jgi:hypothetical protein
MKIENFETSYDLKLTPKKARWKEFLTEFYMIIKYMSGRINTSMNALRIKI